MIYSSQYENVESNDIGTLAAIVSRSPIPALKGGDVRFRETTHGVLERPVRKTKEGKSSSDTQSEIGKPGKKEQISGIQNKGGKRGKKEPIPFWQRKTYTVPVDNTWPAPVACKMNIREWRELMKESGLEKDIKYIMDGF